MTKDEEENEVEEIEPHTSTEEEEPVQQQQQNVPPKVVGPPAVVNKTGINARLDEAAAKATRGRQSQRGPCSSRP